MTVGIIDCGTNTFNLLVAELQPGSWKVVFQSKLPVKLGAGGFEENEIKESRFARGLDALLCHHNNLKNFACSKVYAFGTSALREASNGKAFVDKARELFGFEIDLIEGDKEAELIFSGIQQTIQLSDEPVLVMDIGGGSTEFIIGSAKGIHWKRSFLLGVSRLHDLIRPAERMTREDIIYLRTMLDQELLPLREALNEYPVKTLVGSSGSFDTLLELYLGTQHGHEVKPGLLNVIPLTAFPDIYGWLMKSTYEQRLKHPAIPSIRAEFMPLSAFMVNYILELHPFTHLFHSAYSLKEGALKQVLDTIDWPEEPLQAEQNEAEE